MNDNRILLSGYYGEKNTGDDSFCAIAGYGAIKYWKINKISFLSSDVPVVPFTGKPIFSPRQSFRGQYKLQLMHHFFKNQLIVFAGGSIFHGHEGWERELLYSLNKIKKKKMGAIGVSLGPYRSQKDENKVYEMLKALDFLILRDQSSYNQAQLLDLPYQPQLAFDLAGLLPEIYGKPTKINKNSKNKVLGVVPCHYEEANNKTVSHGRKRETILIEALKAVLNTCEIKIKIMVFNGHHILGDFKNAKTIQSALTGRAEIEIVEYDSSPEIMWGHIASCDAVVSVRLHGAIFACMADIPFLLMEYHRKCSDFLEVIGYPLGLRIPDNCISPMNLSQKILDILEFHNFPIDTQRLTELARKNFLISF